jgi:hypothetical protein
VYNSGCGWEDCPECKDLIALEKETRHRDVANRTLPMFRPDWTAEQFSTAQERIPVALAERREALRRARASRAKAREVQRMKRPLTAKQEAEVLRYLLKCKIRREYLVDGSNKEWLSRVWLELVNPTIAVARKRYGRELKHKNDWRKVLWLRVMRAIYRAQKSLRKETGRASVNVSTDARFDV